MKNDKKNEEIKEEKVDEAEENDKTSECEQRVQNLENQLKRALADYQNLVKRVGEERRDWIKSANKDIILRLLPILDTLILARKHDASEGFSVSIKQFQQALKDEGVEKIETEEKQFDPHIMECVQMEKGEEGKVLEEIRAGYKMGDKVLRPSQVKVGQGKAAS